MNETEASTVRLIFRRYAELVTFGRRAKRLHQHPRLSPLWQCSRAIMRRMDELHLEFPFAGSRMLRDLLNAEGFETGRRHVVTLMKRMAIEAIYRKPNTSKPTPGHKIYPYLLRKLQIDRPNQV